MKPNIVYLDFETSGLDSTRHSVLQAAWIVERNGEVLQERVYDVQPDRNDDFCLAALDMNGFDLARIKAGRYMSHILTILKQDCLQVSSPRICGHNVQFDISFLTAAADRAHENLFLYLDLKKFLDTAAIARFLDYQGVLSLDRYNLDTCCTHFGIVNDRAHDALGDIRATRELFHILTGLPNGKS
ncbi:DNA polymerase III subunit epsilon [Azospirillaceae bacterium]